MFWKIAPQASRQENQGQATNFDRIFRMGRRTGWTGFGESESDVSGNPVDELITAVLQEDASENILKSVHYGYDRAGNRISEQTDTQSGKAMFNDLGKLGSGNKF